MSKLNEMGWDVSKRPRNFIQWKGTDICMDFHCTCGNSFHLDEYFVYAVKCLKCGKTWKLADEIPVKEFNNKKDYWYENAAIGDQNADADRPPQKPSKRVK